ncbi:MAG: hypothetical protein GX231_04820 [Tissierellia bacterium]|nr:hypothetical protein [Tissierellia bacterium]
MRDLNFFEPYIEKRQFKLDRILFLYFLLLVCIIGVFLLGIYNQIRINLLENQIEKRLEATENPKTLKKVNEIKELEKEMIAFKEEVDRIIELDRIIEETSVINEELLYDIRSKMPGDLFLTNFSANDRSVQISGVSRDSYSIAEFSKGLELINNVESVFVSSINNIEDYYSFVLNLTFKDVGMDEKQTVED